MYGDPESESGRILSENGEPKKKETDKSGPISEPDVTRLNNMLKLKVQGKKLKKNAKNGLNVGEINLPG